MVWPQTSLSMLTRLGEGAEQHSWEEFSTQYRPAIFRFCRRLGLQDADADDATQKVLQQVADSFARRPPDLSSGRFRSWLSQVARHTSLKIIQRDHRHRGSGRSEVLQQLNAVAADEEQLQAVWLAEERVALYRRAAAEVRGNCTRAVWAAFEQTSVAGRSVEQVATELGVSTGVVYASRSRVLKRIRRLVEELMQSEASDHQEST